MSERWLPYFVDYCKHYSFGCVVADVGLDLSPPSDESFDGSVRSPDPLRKAEGAVRDCGGAYGIPFGHS